MKSPILPAALLCTLLTAVNPAWAAETLSASASPESSTVRTTVSEESSPWRLSDLNMAVNPQIGMSSFNYSGNQGGSQQKLSGGTTVEFGGAARKLETGLLLMQTSANVNLNDGTSTQINTSYLTIPLMAKLRVIQLHSQSWYLKMGAMTAMAVGGSNRAAANPIDVLGSVGMAGRFGLTKTSDFIIDATYNRGFMDALQSTSNVNYNQGVLVLAGISFRI